MSTPPKTLRHLAERGVARCRQGDWDTGMAFLAKVAGEENSGMELPSTFHSYLGFGLAHRERLVREGLELCRHACKINFYEPENYVNLARTCLLAGNRAEAIQAIRRGYALDPGSSDLRQLHRRLGIRRRPVLRFLGRQNLLNRLLGRVRHDLRRDSTDVT